MNGTMSQIRGSLVGKPNKVLRPLRNSTMIITLQLSGGTKEIKMQIINMFLGIPLAFKKESDT